MLPYFDGLIVGSDRARIPHPPLQLTVHAACFDGLIVGSENVRYTHQ